MQQILITLTPDGKLEFKMQVKHPALALFMLEKAKQLVLEPPKDQGSAILTAQVAPRFNGNR